MKYLISIFLTLMCLVAGAQTTPPPFEIFGKKVVIRTRDTSSAELQILNATRNVPGYFKNIGSGQGAYTLIQQSDVQKLSDTFLTRLRLIDTAAMLSRGPLMNRFLDTARALQSRIQTKLALSDTAAMLSPYLRTSSTGIYIRNQFTSAQAADAWISGRFRSASIRVLRPEQDSAVAVFSNNTFDPFASNFSGWRFQNAGGGNVFRTQLEGWANGVRGVSISPGTQLQPALGAFNTWGFFQAFPQSSLNVWIAGFTGGWRLFSDSSNRLSWLQSSAFSASFEAGSLDANRIYTLPNVSGNVILNTSASFSTTISSTVSSGNVFQSQSGNGMSFNNTGFAFNRNISTGAIYNSGGFAYQWQRTPSTTATSDFFRLQVYNTAGTQVTDQAISVNGAGNISFSGSATASGGLFSTSLQVLPSSATVVSAALVAANASATGGFNRPQIQLRTADNNTWLIRHAGDGGNSLQFTYNDVAIGQTITTAGLTLFGTNTNNGSGAVAQFNGNITPTTDNTRSLGTAGFRWSDIRSVTATINAFGQSATFGASSNAGDNWIRLQGQSVSWDLGARQTSSGSTFGIAEAGIAYRLTIAPTTGVVNVLSNTPSTSTTTGALVVGGGIGANGTITAPGFTSTGTATLSGLSGTGNRIVIANGSNALVSAVIGSGLAFDGTTLTATGGSSGSITGSGTSGTVALFSGSSSISNSIITQASTTVTVAGTLAATTINGAGTGLTGTASGLSIGGNAATVTNGVYTSSTYADPAWITSLGWSKITGAPAFITGNQTITLSGPVTGSGTTSITTTIGAGAVTNAMLAGSIDYSKMNAATVPTWNQNTTGNAATATNATQWNGQTYSSTPTAVNTFLMGFSGSAWVPVTASSVQTFLSLGSYAYRSSGLAELSGAAFTGAVVAPNFVVNENDQAYILRTNAAWTGWARMHASFQNSAGTVMGGIGGYGTSASNLTYFWAGNTYENRTIEIDAGGSKEVRTFGILRVNSDQLLVDGGSGSGRLTFATTGATNTIFSTTTAFGSYNGLRLQAAGWSLHNGTGVVVDITGAGGATFSNPISVSSNNQATSRITISNTAAGSNYSWVAGNVNIGQTGLDLWDGASTIMRFAPSGAANFIGSLTFPTFSGQSGSSMENMGPGLLTGSSTVIKVVIGGTAYYFTAYPGFSPI